MAEKTPETTIAARTAEAEFAVKPFAAGLSSSALAASPGYARTTTCSGNHPIGLDQGFRTANKKPNAERGAGKDLFARTFHEFSRWTHEEYHAHFIERLPHRLLQAAAELNPQLKSCRGFGELHDLFASVRGRRWNNPELYPFLNYLNMPSNEMKAPAFLQSAVDALRIHVGLDSVRAVAEPPVTFWRLRDPSAAVFREICTSATVSVFGQGRGYLHGVMRKVEDVSAHEREAEPFPIVYRPYPHLFDDIDPQLYWGHGCQLETKQLWRLAKEAVRVISSYSTELAAGFCREISTVAFLAPKPGTGEFGSFSKRNFYIGGIFVSIAGPISVAEQFIHEYYHQTIWPWWMIEPPTDLPADDQIIVSPITGRPRSLLSMIQGLLINYSLIDYYRFILSPPQSSDLEGDQRERAKARLATIEGGMGALLVALKGALSQRPHCGAIVEFIASRAAM
jgi:hypothetical protein